MAMRVLKFGGTSVADPERIRRCAGRIAATRREGHDTVVVVSAMGHTTDNLIDLARQVCTTTGEPQRRPLDMLLATGEQVSAALMVMALVDMGMPAVALPPHLLGVRTDGVDANARIVSIATEKIRSELAAGRVVVVPGFQGLADDGRVTTLGRGGSDTTAVAFAAALLPAGSTADLGEGDACEIFTDVDGVYTADPRHVPLARRIERITYEEMVELASLGAGVLHTRAVMLGQRFGVPIHVRHSALPENGTMVVPETPEMERAAVVGCALTPDLGRIGMRNLPKGAGTQALVFEQIAKANILVDDIIQTEHDDAVDLSFTVEVPNLPAIKSAAADAIAVIGAGEISIEVGLAKVSAVGVGMRTHTGVAAVMFRALAEAGIPIHNITTSEIKISCILPRERGPEALRVVHDAFGLGGAPVPARAAASPVEVK